MSVYNGERFLAEAIQSVLEQSFADFEFNILDDGSSDSTSAILGQFATQDERINVLTRENRGLTASLNQLLGMCKAPLVARMDADDICHPERFAHQVRFLDKNPDYGVIGSWITDIDETGDICAPGRIDHPVSHEEFLVAIDRRLPLLCHPTVMFRVEPILSIGGYRDAFRHCEDLDLWLRLVDVTRIGNLPLRLLEYRNYDQQVSCRHATEQLTGDAVARLAYAERKAGRVDPTEALPSLPSIDMLDALFEKQGTARAVRARVAPGLLYSKAALSDNGFDIIMDHVRDGGNLPGIWRTVLRLVSFGLPLRASRLAYQLVITAGQRSGN